MNHQLREYEIDTLQPSPLTLSLEKILIHRHLLPYTRCRHHLCLHRNVYNMIAQAFYGHTLYTSRNLACAQNIIFYGDFVHNLTV